MSTNEKARYSISEATHYLGIGRTKLYEHINSGKISVTKDGRRTLILRRELDRFVESDTSNGGV